MKKTIAFLLLVLFAFNGNAQSKKNQVIQIKTSAECDECKKKIESNLIYEKGVKFCKLNVETKMLSVTYNPEKTNSEKIKLAVSKLGYDADEIKADSLEYAKLPACCKVDGMEHEK
jgi:mercuric ion binding protein